jgi:hypothetical protein
MQLSEIFLGQGEPAVHGSGARISIGKLKTYQLYDRMKVRFHLAKLNSENMKKATPRFWARINEKDEEFATDLAQAILVSHLDMIKAVIDDLGIPNQDGFFDKDIDGSKYLTDGWQQRTYEKFKDAYPRKCCCFTSTIWLGNWRRAKKFSRFRRKFRHEPTIFRGDSRGRSRRRGRAAPPTPHCWPPKTRRVWALTRPRSIPGATTSRRCCSKKAWNWTCSPPAWRARRNECGGIDRRESRAGQCL